MFSDFSTSTPLGILVLLVASDSCCFLLLLFLVTLALEQLWSNLKNKLLWIPNTEWAKEMLP